VKRRDLLVGGAVTGASLFAPRAFAQTSATRIIQWTDQPAPIPPPAENAIRNLTRWEDLDSWITPNDKFFSIAHYNRPQIDGATWRLGVSGRIDNPLTLDQLKAMPRQEITFTLECSGDNGLPFFQSGIGNHGGQAHH
jgi:DMSO/TMAO reductase YedYZ molybdopterin-dependent catalytic subunit